MAWSRRDVLVLAGAGTLALGSKGYAAAATSSNYDAAIVIDGLGGPGSLTAPPGGPLSPDHLQDVRRSGLTCVHVTVGPVGTTPPDQAFVQAVRDIAWLEREIDAHPDILMRVRTLADITAAKRTGRTGLIYGFQDGVTFETDLARLADLYQLGIRVVQPTYNRRNLLGDGCLETADAGLSQSGFAAIEQMNALGILVDLSHCGRRTAADAIRASKTPVAFTHTGCFALAAHPRNRTDEELRAVARGGGVCGIYFMPYLSGGRQPTAEDVIRHLEHMIDVAGEDHVSIGTDGTVSPAILDAAYKEAFARNVRERRAAGIGAPDENETGYLFVDAFNTPRRLQTLADMLQARGHTAARVDKILGANLQRVFAQSWRA